MTERMASLMCVDIDLELETDEAEEDGEKLDAREMVERQVGRAKDEGDITWLELDELGIDDDMLLSLDLPSKFPVCFFFPVFMFLSLTLTGSMSFLEDFIRKILIFEDCFLLCAT